MTFTVASAPDRHRRRYGSPFDESVLKTATCWLWIAAKSGAGYGQITVNGKVEYAHRVSWERENGPIPEGSQVLHRCDNPPCVRPAHLFLGDAADNMRDKARKGRAASVLTEDQVRLIRSRYAAGESQQAIAESVGISRPMVGYIVRGEMWAWVR